jgi:hypothetical protein
MGIGEVSIPKSMLQDRKEEAGAISPPPSGRGIEGDLAFRSCRLTEFLVFLKRLNRRAAAIFVCESSFPLKSSDSPEILARD